MGLLYHAYIIASEHGVYVQIADLGEQLRMQEQQLQELQAELATARQALSTQQDKYWKDMNTASVSSIVRSHSPAALFRYTMLILPPCYRCSACNQQGGT